MTSLGTFSINELAVDLTCDPVHFSPATSEQEWHPNEDVPGHLFADEEPHPPKSPTDDYQVHSGMLKLARVMGERGKPLHSAIRNALKRNPGYGMRL
jgi:sn1-specific diacylglycerol lipase